MTQDLEKLKKDLENKASTGFASKLSNLKSKISDMKSNSKHTLLVDVSGSMASIIHDKRAIEIVQEVLDNFVGAKIYEFNSNCKLVTKLSEPRNGTAMHVAFEKLKADGIYEATLITDGAPDSESAALDAVKGLKLNIIYIGPDPMPSFLNRLAKYANGAITNVALLEANSNKALENKIRLMLNA